MSKIIIIGTPRHEGDIFDAIKPIERQELRLAERVQYRRDVQKFGIVIGFYKKGGQILAKVRWDNGKKDILNPVELIAIPHSQR